MHLRFVINHLLIYDHVIFIKMIKQSFFDLIFGKANIYKIPFYEKPATILFVFISINQL